MFFLDKLINKYKGSESFFSMILGVLVVLVVGNQVISFINKIFTKNTKPIDNSITVPNIEEPGNTFYVVKKGDYLYKIAKDKLGDGNLWPEIAKLNNIANPNSVNEGDKFTLPKISDENTTIDSTPNTQSDLLTTDKYTVVANDSLWIICIKTYGDGYQWPKVAKANNLKNPNLLEKGQVLVIPR